MQMTVGSVCKSQPLLSTSVFYKQERILLGELYIT